MKTKVWSILLVFFSISLQAGTQPLFTLTPLTPTKFSIASDETATVQYRIVNQTNVTRTLMLANFSSRAGIRQVTSGIKACSNPFRLMPLESCVLTLSMHGSELVSDVKGEPAICKTKGGTSHQPDPFLCSRASKADGLDIIPVDEKRPVLFVEPSTLSLITNGNTQSLTVTNSATHLIARNIRADFSGTELDGNVSQDASGCEYVEPGKSCTLTFTPGANAISLTSFPIEGDNTLIVGASIEVISDTTAGISVTGSPIVLEYNELENLIVTNNSTLVDATNIQVHNVPTSITVGSTGCDVVARNGGTCTLSFSAGTTAVTETMLDIYGDNTSRTAATIAVNAPLADIAFAAGSPTSLTLLADDTDTGTMVIQNTSNDPVLAGLTADFSSTALNGFVTASTCDEIPANGTCTLTFTAGNTRVNSTIFPIYGPNTNTLTASIAINSAPEAYLTGNNTNTVDQCIINADTGNLEFCQTFSNLGLGDPRGIVLNSAKTMAYIVNKTSATVTQCEIDQANLQFINCVNANANGLSSPVGITLDPTGTYAYVTNEGDNTISQCTLQGDGGFGSTCINSGATGLNKPVSIVIKSTNDVAYIAAGHSSSKMIQCNVSSGGSLSGCTSLFNGYNDQATGNAMNSAQTRIYEVGYGGDTHVHYYRCTLTSTGVENCTRNDEGRTSSTTGMIAVNLSDSLAYIGVTVTDQYLKCIIGSEGALSCSIKTTPMKANWGIALIE